MYKKHKRYTGLIEEEYIHDINTLGNINVNDSLMFVVITKEYNEMLENFAKNLGFEVCTVDIKNIDESLIATMACNGKKTVLFVLYNE